MIGTSAAFEGRVALLNLTALTFSEKKVKACDHVIGSWSPKPDMVEETGNHAIRNTCSSEEATVKILILFYFLCYRTFKKNFLALMIYNLTKIEYTRKRKNHIKINKTLYDILLKIVYND